MAYKIEGVRDGWVVMHKSCWYHQSVKIRPDKSLSQTLETAVPRECHGLVRSSEEQFSEE